ncbi:MAG TPA: aminoglycoside phosphotransferase family protein [Thermomicrobiaceae bacterium]|nr:aminoglycoside phosphotransferase family protein [Thermomicrobiaceae bacterium]
MTETQRAWRERISTLHPELVSQPVRLLGEGQNNDLVLSGEIVFRLRRYPGRDGSNAHEAAVLRAIAPHLPLAVPAPLDVAPDLLSYPLIPGEPLPRDRIPAQALPVVAAQLGRFLWQLHHAPFPAVLQDERARFQPMREWEDLYERARASVYPLLSAAARRHVTRHFAAFFERQRRLEIAPAVIHGDFGAGNILWEAREAREAQVTGVIDFSSAGVGDPAVDLAAASTIAPDLLDALGATYPGIAGVAGRIDFYRGTFLLQEALFGAETGDQDALSAGLQGVEQQAR